MKLCITIRENERGGYTAICSSLPGCMSHGKTREEATKKLDEAIRGYLAAVGDYVPTIVTQEVIEA